jgi:hypothetical protein
MEVNYTPIGVIFEISITILESKALWELLTHVIGVHIKFLIVVNVKIFASRLTSFYY